MIYGSKLMLLAGLLVIQVVYLRRHPELAQPSLTAGIARRMIWRAGLFAAIPVLSMAAAFYNTRLGLYLYFLLPVVHFLPGRVDAIAPPVADDA